VPIGLALRRPQVAAGHLVPVGLVLVDPPVAQSEIIEDLEAALVQFRLIEADFADNSVAGEQHEER